MGWPPGIAKAFMFEAREQELADPEFVAGIFRDLDSVAEQVDYAWGAGGMPMDISPGSSAHDRAVQLVSSVLPALRLSDLAAVAAVIRSMLTQRGVQVPAVVEALDEIIARLPQVDDYQMDSAQLTAATGRMSWLLSGGDRLAARDRVMEKLAAHDEDFAIEDEQGHDDHA